MSRLLSSEVSDGTEIPDDEQGVFQIPFEIHLEIGSSVLRWKARLPATRGRQPGTKQASGTDTTRGLKGLCTPQASPDLCWMPRDSIFLKAQASSLLIMRDSFH